MDAPRAWSPAEHVPALALLATCALTGGGIAQVRMNLRSTMQIDPLAVWSSATSMDERFWPVEPTGFAAGDVDGDGDLDLLMADNNGLCRVWLNDGSGGFTRFIALPSSRSGGCALFDADGDGDLDALFAGGGTSYGGPNLSTLYRNDGNGVFTLSPTIPASYFNDFVDVRTIGVGDFDGDGDLDIVLFAAGTHPRYWRNDGNCTFTDQSAIAWPGAPPGTYGWIRGAVADVDLDGDLDVITTGPAQLYRNNGLGVFTIEPGIPWPIPSPDRVTVDVDGDTLADEVGVENDVPFVHRNVGGGVLVDVSSTWFEPHALVDRTPGWGIHACAVFDADGDGHPDLVTGGSEQRGGSSTTVGVPPKLFLNSNGQRFVEGGRSALPMLNDTVNAMAAGDVDGDGDVDLVLACVETYFASAAHPTQVWRQDAAGRFVEGAVPFTQWLSALALADVDGDGDLDLIGIGGWGPLYPGVPLPHRLALNDGSGNFTDVTATHLPASAVSGGASVAAGDVDGDGDIDLVIGSYSANWGGSGVPLMLLLNTGGGVFVDASAQLPATPYESSYVELRDFDGDGDLDIVVAANPQHPISPPILFFANNGAGTFTDVTAARMPATGPATGLQVLDLDHDGDLDIAQSNVNLWNNGAGVFTASAVSGTRLLLADFDEDTLPDALGLGPSGGISVVGGRTVFQDQGAIDHILLPVDLDGDGDLDLVVGPVFSFGGSIWTMLRVELVYNLRRDLRVATLPRVGHPYRLQLRATNGSAATLAIVAFATATLPQPVEIPGWGALRIDPTQMAVLGTALIPDADTTAEMSMPIPSTPTLFGLPLSCQALFVPIGNEAQTHLSNAMTFPLER